MTFDPTRSGAQQLVDLGNTFAQALQHDKPVRASVRMTTEGHGFETEQRAAFDAWLRTVKMLATGAVTQPIAGSSAWSVASGSPHIDLCTDDPCLLEVHGDTRIGRHNVRRDACFAPGSESSTKPEKSAATRPMVRRLSPWSAAICNAASISSIPGT